MSLLVSNPHSSQLQQTELERGSNSKKRKTPYGLPSSDLPEETLKTQDLVSTLIEEGTAFARSSDDVLKTPPKKKRATQELTSTFTRGFGKLLSPLKDVRAKHLDPEITTSPIKSAEKTEYGHCPFSKRAIEYKKKNNISAGRNVSIVAFQMPGTDAEECVIKATEGFCQAHAELKAYDELPPEVRKNHALITSIYTERAPCNRSSGSCTRKLKQKFGVRLGTTIALRYSQDYHPVKEIQARNEEKFQRLQEKLGIRRAS